MSITQVDFKNHIITNKACQDPGARLTPGSFKKQEPPRGTNPGGLEKEHMSPANSDFKNHTITNKACQDPGARLTPGQGNIMPDYRCLNNLMGYCRTRPHVQEGTAVYHYPGFDGKPVIDLYPTASCVNQWWTCPEFITWAEECQRIGVTQGEK